MFRHEMNDTATHRHCHCDCDCDCDYIVRALLCIRCYRTHIIACMRVNVTADCTAFAEIQAFDEE
jgi:hypothetical protein